MATMSRLACACLLAWIALSSTGASSADAAIRRRMIVVSPARQTVVATRVTTVTPYGPLVSRTTWMGPRRVLARTPARPPAGMIIRRRIGW